MEKLTTSQVALKWGAILGVISIVITTVLYVTGLWKNTWISSASLVIGIVALVLAMKEYKEAHQGLMSFGQGVTIGFTTMTISGLLGALYQTVYTQFIDTTIPEQIKDMQIEAFEKQGMSDEMIEQSLESMSAFSSPGVTFLFAVLGSMFIGLILALIISAVMKKNKPAMDF